MSCCSHLAVIVLISVSLCCTAGLIVSCFRRDSYSSFNLWICIRLSLVCMYLGRVLYSKGGGPLVVYIFVGVGRSIENG